MQAAWFWTAYVGAGALCVLLAWLGARRRQLRPLDLTATVAAVECAACGYDVRGLPGTICPECGSDLAQVGRVTPQFRRWQKLPPVMRAIVWTILVLLVGCFCGAMALLNVVPIRDTSSSVSTLVPAAGRLEDSQRRMYEMRTERVVTLAGGLIGLGPADLNRSVAVLRVHAILPNSDKQGADTGVRMRFDCVTGDWQLFAGERLVLSGNGLPLPETALKLVELGRSGAPPSTQPAAEKRRDQIEAATLFVSLFNVVRTERRSDGRVTHAGIAKPLHELLPEDWPVRDPRALYLLPGRPSDSGHLLANHSSSQSAHPDWKWLVPAAGFWLLVWLLGIRFVVRRRAVRVLRDAAPLPAAAAS